MSHIKQETKEEIRTAERERLWLELKRYEKGDMGPSYVFIREIEHLFKP